MTFVFKKLFFPKNEPEAKNLRLGLLRGIRFILEPANSIQRLVGLAEQEITAPVRSFTSLARTAIDVGGAEGWYALYFASQPQIEKVFLFEPDQHLRQRVEANFALNSSAWREKLEVRREFVSAQPREGHCRLDDILAATSGPMILKVDVDGGELDVLQGARETLRAKQCLVVVETHSLDLEEKCLSELINLGYKTRVVRNAWYRRFIPELRPMPHNRWLLAWK